MRTPSPRAKPQRDLTLDVPLLFASLTGLLGPRPRSDATGFGSFRSASYCDGTALLGRYRQRPCSISS